MRVKFMPGDAITAVYPHLGGRSVMLMRVDKVGRKYLHGITLSRSPNGAIREGHPHRINIEDSTIYPGLRHELRDAEYKHRLAVQQWQRRKQSRKDEVARDFWDYVRGRMDKWEAVHPVPPPPEFPAPEAS